MRGSWAGGADEPNQPSIATLDPPSRTEAQVHPVGIELCVSCLATRSIVTTPDVGWKRDEIAGRVSGWRKSSRLRRYDSHSCRCMWEKGYLLAWN